MNLTVPANWSRCRCSRCTAWASIAVCASWPQACIRPLNSLAKSSPVSSGIGRASMSPRKRIVRPVCPPGFVPPSDTTRPEVEGPRAISTSHPCSASSTASVVSGRLSPSSGLAWMRRRNVTAAGSSARASSRKRCNSDMLAILRAVIAPAVYANLTIGASYDALGAQRGDLGHPVTEALQDLVGVLAEERRRAAIGAGGFRQLDRGRGQRHGPVEAGIGPLFEEAGGADMVVVERLLQRIHLTGDDAGLFELGQRLGATLRRAPFAHPRRDDLAVIGTRLIVGKARIGEPFLFADHPAPAPEHRLPDHRRDDPGDRGAQQCAFDLLAASGLAALVKRGQRAKGGEASGPEIDPGSLAGDRLLLHARQVHRAAHRLADAVEAVLVAERPARAEAGNCGEDDVGFYLAQAVEVERQRAQYRGRQIGDDDIGRRDELPDDLAALRRSRVQGHAALVAVHREEHRAAALGSSANRDEGAVLAAADPLDADHLGTEIAQQRGAERPRDIAAEIEDANPVEHTGHQNLQS